MFPSLYILRETVTYPDYGDVKRTLLACYSVDYFESLTDKKLDKDEWLPTVYAHRLREFSPAYLVVTDGRSGSRREDSQCYGLVHRL